MSYSPPSGNSANFSTGYLELPRPYNGLSFKFGRAAYTAPSGNAVIAKFPAATADWIAPLGDAVNFSAWAYYPDIVGIGEVALDVMASGVAAHGVAAQGNMVFDVGAAGMGGHVPSVFGYGEISLDWAIDALFAHGVSGSGRLALGFGNTAGVGEKGPRRLRTTTAVAWFKAGQAINDLISPRPAARSASYGRQAPWVEAVPVDTANVSAFVRPGRRDAYEVSRWISVGDKRIVNRAVCWSTATRRDDFRFAPWSFFGDRLHEDRQGRWYGAKTADARRALPWGGFLIPIILPAPYARPSGNAADFQVIGGGIVAQFGNATYAAPLGHAVNVHFGGVTYRPPFYTPTAQSYQPPTGDTASFLYAPQFTPAVDAMGNPILGPPILDAVKHVPWGITVNRDVDRNHPWSRFTHPINSGWGIAVPGTLLPLPGQQIIIPLQRVYIVINEVLLVRVSDATPITALSLSVSFDCDSWVPTFSATIPESERAAVMPNPTLVEVQALINGVAFNFMVERIQRSRQFGQATISIGGRGIACELDAPYAAGSHHTNAVDKTVQQLIGDALQYSTYTQTWGITDWLVPANTFSLFGTPIQVAQHVAEASGSVLQAGWDVRDLRMLPRYPVVPWNWATAIPDYVIPGAVTQSESVEWIEKPSYNVVYVSGAENGVLGQVKITGTAGDVAAPMVTHPLITHNDAARQRGISILADTGRKAMMQISLPVLPTTGVFDVCKLVEFNDGAATRRGIVRANQITAIFPTLWQTLTIEAAA